MNRVGYYRHATISGNAVAFVCEDDLWTFQRGERLARRITAGLSEISTPRLSPHGEWIAFVSREEGHPEVAVVEAEGGPIRRLTHLGAEACLVSGWSSDGASVLFASDAHSPFSRDTTGYEIALAGGSPKNLQLGHLRSFAYGAGGAMVLSRNADDPARWKRYRGGTAGDLWVDATGSGEFARLITLKGNLVTPMWIGQRIFFLSDHEGIGNIYSCTTSGEELRRHTHEHEYYARFPSTDGTRIIYTAAGALRVLDVERDTVETLNVETPSSAPQTARRFVAGADLLEHVQPSPGGEQLALVSRGQSFTMPLWEDAALRFAGGEGGRSRLSCWLHDGERLAYVNDAHDFERIECRGLDLSAPQVLTETSLGRFNELVASPVDNVLAFTTHRHELGILTIETCEVRILDASPAAKLYDLCFSPDGRYLAYAIATAVPPAVANPDCSIIRVVEIATGALHDITSLLRTDRSPAWDPEGRFLAFLSARDFNPVYDALQFDLSFPQATRPFLVTLRRDITSPFVGKAAPIYRDDKDDKDEAADEESESSETKPEAAGDTPATAAKPVMPIEIDFEGIAGRMLGFPVEEGDYGQLVAAKGRVIFTRFPVRGISPSPRSWDDDERNGLIQSYEFRTKRLATIADNVSEIVLGSDARTLIYRSEERVRVIDAGGELPEDEQPEPDDAHPARKNGWIDLSRLSLEIDPAREWEQIYHEAWRLQREHFWDEAMSQIDWDLVRTRYAALLPLVRTRTELSDLIWEMQGELGTSHAYEIGGDHRRPVHYRRGFLGGTFALNDDGHGYQIIRILRGDSWDRSIDSPLAAPGVDVREGDLILAVGDRRIDSSYTLDAALVNTANREIQLTISREGSVHRVIVKTLRDERALRYRNWVETNRRLVHETTGGRAGYVHIPDMGPWGFSEFHRGFLAEFNRAGLIVDARHNRGGHISPLLLEKLARKRVGYDIPRYGPALPYPPESVAGPIVALTDQFAGSDGDIFSHCFKLYGLGPLVGKRTWGGVIGINPSHELIDGTVTTQPEYSFWFSDVGWSVENYGTEPDFDIDITPQDVRAGHDPQLAKALALVQTAIASAPATPPTFTPRPNLRLPTSLP